MDAQEQLTERGVDVRRVEYGDGVELVADFGPVENASADVVDGTVIAVVDGDQYDIEVDGDTRAFIRNGVLTIEVNA